MDHGKVHVEDLPILARKLNAKDRLLLSGVIYTARDAAHQEIVQALRASQSVPFRIDGAVIYYAGPTQAPKSLPIGSCGPTTSARMDPYTPLLLDNGLAAMIGKGPRNQEVLDAIVRNRAVYLCAVGGAGALAARCVRACEIIAYEELGCEAVRRLRIEDFPLIVGIDSKGGCAFQTQALT